ncbi:hypothetical protein AVEN_118391-1 [Araneus ventricosus]|uniref:DNA helicase Pif1-like 2B domain-containing protein n=1 Tax=Araneus ventricosus TaxID=182803 RepID=A0A4Y2B7U3_ARAVE|nr:hypothetical protein AVEN_118391-1 [Araneus ventricosus]
MMPLLRIIKWMHSDTKNWKDFQTSARSEGSSVSKCFTALLDHSWLCQRAILAPRNEDVSIMNKQLLQELPGSVQVYKSIDTICDTNEAVNYPAEFLNTLQPSGVPLHTLELKSGTPIMLFRHLHSPSICNGTRLCIKKLMPNIIEATIMTGHAAGEDVYIPRIPIIPSDFPFQFKRIQFPVRLI